ncbi:sugar phosphate nucleotidyltransferase [Flagellimonas abyssi]|uniref:NTP transferase domain-containing protein n=1 Tax=Flagellimonas abyssi TaxID=2864871 RepID=A0ABS7ESP9_9FLAO|nr:sugar phosphate nucleotidyltransferase [Allomuricauda abyssi]MBW8200610.1 NTP transferase domain-containing protein [Allomuricauda abyssi]
MSSLNSLVVLAGGASSRMKKNASNQSILSAEEIQQANERSKGLIGLGGNGRPMLDYVLYNAKRAGYEKIYIVIGEQGELFRDFYGGSNGFHGLEVVFAIQRVPSEREKPFGTADALCQAMEQYPELQEKRFTVCNSDNLYSVEAFDLLRNTESPQALITYDRDALEFDSERISRFALVKMDDWNNLIDIIEKPKLDEVGKYRDTKGKLRVSMNIFTFDGKKLFPYLKHCPVHPVRLEKELSTALLGMLGKFSGDMKGIPMAEHVPDLTAKNDIVEVKKYLKEHYSTLEW